MEPTLHTRPQSLEELYNLEEGRAVFDAHNPMPKWLRDYEELKAISVNRRDVETLLCWNVESPFNKIVYVVSKTEHCITMACAYDEWGFIYSIQL